MGSGGDTQSKCCILLQDDDMEADSKLRKLIVAPEHQQMEAKARLRNTRKPVCYAEASTTITTMSSESIDADERPAARFEIPEKRPVATRPGAMMRCCMMIHGSSELGVGAVDVN